jgi:hypothetical protein
LETEPAPAAAVVGVAPVVGGLPAEAVLLFELLHALNSNNAAAANMTNRTL